ncbi:hypothetical protein TNCV_1073021 [Trichonephila clavipes]|nr:hypothetical protein TNCV_1073021 [Trichonephila clavipes]
MAGPSVTSHVNALCYLRKYISPGVSEVIPVTSERVTFGTGGSCDIILECKDADERHCALVRRRFGWCVIDFEKYCKKVLSELICEQHGLLFVSFNTGSELFQQGPVLSVLGEF